MRSELLAIPQARAEVATLSELYGFTLARDPDGAAAPGWPIKAEVQYADGRTEKLTVREGAGYSSGVRIARAWLWAPRGGGNVLADVQRFLEDFAMGPPHADRRQLREQLLTAQSGVNYAGTTIRATRPPWARSLRIFQQASSNVAWTTQLRLVASPIRADGSVGAYPLTQDAAGANATPTVGGEHEFMTFGPACAEAAAAALVTGPSRVRVPCLPEGGVSLLVGQGVVSGVGATGGIVAVWED